MAAGRAHIDRDPIGTRWEVDAHISTEVDSVEEVCVCVGKLQPLEIEWAVVLQPMLHLRHLRWQSWFRSCEVVGRQEFVEGCGRSGVHHGDRWRAHRCTIGLILETKLGTVVERGADVDTIADGNTVRNSERGAHWQC